MDNRRFYLCMNGHDGIFEFPDTTGWIEYWDENDENTGGFMPVCWFVFAGNGHIDIQLGEKVGVAS